MIASDEMNSYFSKIKNDVMDIYELAILSRKKALDPISYVEIPLAEDMASRVEGLVSTFYPRLINSGLAQRIRELEDQYGKGDELVAFTIARELYENKFLQLTPLADRIELGLRVGLAYLTLGIVTAPLEGITKVQVKKRHDGGDYLAVYFSGPIRSAGGTANAFAVLLADYLRRLAGLSEYDPDEQEIERYAVEIDDYDTRITNLQYRIKPEEIRFIIKRTPVEISGDPTEQLEVISFKDLPRIETNRIRSGMCLTISMLGLKASKLLKRIRKYGKELNLENWEWLETYLAFKKSLAPLGTESKAEKKIAPNFSFMEDVPGGRPIFSYPSKIGGFRLRYGRSRNTGYACVGVHPATMAVLDDFIAVGTQLKLERPGKGATAAVVDSIEPPVVKLKNGDVLRLSTAKDVKASQIDSILFLGDILISYGEFVSNGHPLVPAGYCEEEWLTELRNSLSLANWSLEEAAAAIGLSSLRFREILDGDPVSPLEAIRLAEKLKIPLHPLHTFFFPAVSTEEVQHLCRVLKSAPRSYDGSWVASFTTPNDPIIKDILERLCIPHRVHEGHLHFDEAAHVLLLSLGLLTDDAAFEQPATTALDLIQKISPIQIRDKAGSFIGARMGRPEKAERRLMVGRPHVLFPVGQAGGRMRSLTEAATKLYNAELAHRICTSCGKRNVYLTCTCGGTTVAKRLCAICGKLTDKEIHCNAKTKSSSLIDIDLRGKLDSTASRLGERLPSQIKGVRGLSSDPKIPEKVEKGILRAKYSLFVNKDGTTRFDSTNVPLTHFKPKEIRTPVEKLLKLGYTKDITGAPLAHDDQVVELKAQDILLSDFVDPKKTLISGAAYLVAVANFIDDLLEKFYSLPRFYNIKTKEDLIGHYVVALAPHTSAGIVARLIGFTDARVGFAHPMFHAAKRRDCDGDEDSIMLLLDALINFSRQFLPSTRGSSTMDVPLVLTTVLDPTEIDDGVHDLDIAWSYPLELYEKAANYEPPTVKIELLKKRVNTPAQYEGLGFTHPTTNIQDGPKMSAYKSLGPMLEKVEVQLRLAEKIRAVDQDNVANLVVSSHFIKDIKGNLRTFCRQQFRCIDCNEKFRRVPLIGKCTKCGGKLVLTVHRGTIEKYLEPSIRICEKYNVPLYMRQELTLLQRRILGMFGKEQQQSLKEFF